MALIAVDNGIQNIIGDRVKVQWLWLMDHKCFFGLRWYCCACGPVNSTVLYMFCSW